jgi:hypothetical protein
MVSLGFVGDWCFWVSFVEVCVTFTDWTVQSGLWRGTIHTTMYRVRLLRLLRLPVGSVARWNWFAEFVFESLHLGVSVGNTIGDELAKALGGALKDNTTLTSLSLELCGE